MSVIRSELGFLEELDDAFLVPFPGIPCAHGPSIPSLLPREVSGFVIRAIVRRAFPPLRGNRCQNLRDLARRSSCFCEVAVVCFTCAGELRVRRRRCRRRLFAAYGWGCEVRRLFQGQVGYGRWYAPNGIATRIVPCNSCNTPSNQKTRAPNQ